MSVTHAIQSFCTQLYLYVFVTHLVCVVVFYRLAYWLQTLFKTALAAAGMSVLSVLSLLSMLSMC